MATGAKARHFARAVFSVAAKLGEVDDFLDRFELLSLTFRENKAFRHLLITHRIPIERKMEVLHSAFGKALTNLELEVLRLLLVQNMGLQLPAVTRYLVQEARAKDARLELTVYSPQPLAVQELKSLTDRVQADLGRSLRVMDITDPGLLGGIKLRLGNALVDGTVARRLELLREELV
ncbi:MAG: ATP synthase F1 subunit delta [Fidelibacterota bacterium]|nr:MAG: ATP synthase F1 subunit delta [Candidatus Neomarinimicrobiota bacterium]